MTQPQPFAPTDARAVMLRQFATEPWAILPAWLELSRAALLAEGVEYEAAAARPVARSGAVAVLPIHGPISQRMSLFSFFFGGASTQGISAAFRSLVADETVGAIVLDIDSPGGSVFGVAELAEEIFRARGAKPIIAVANAVMASAAYHIGAAADEIVVTPSGEAGSIGVFTLHTDIARALDAEGVTVTLISAGKYKTEGNPFEPLSDEARAAIQHEVDAYYALFVNAVAKYRGVTAAAVKSGYGEGRLLNARDAVKAGLADRIATLDETVQRALGGRRGGARADVVTPDATEVEMDGDGSAVVAPASVAPAVPDMERLRRRQRLRERERR